MAFRECAKPHAPRTVSPHMIFFLKKSFYRLLVCAWTRAFQWVFVRPLEMKTHWDMTLGLTTVTATSALSRETPTKETPETAETHIEKRLKRLWVRTGETLKRPRSTSTGRWWLVWVSGGRKWVLGSSKAVNVACLAVFDPSTNSAVSRQPCRRASSAVVRYATAACGGFAGG